LFIANINYLYYDAIIKACSSDSSSPSIGCCDTIWSGHKWSSSLLSCLSFQPDWGGRPPFLFYGRVECDHIHHYEISLFEGINGGDTVSDLPQFLRPFYELHNSEENGSKI